MLNNSELFDFLPFMVNDERSFSITMQLSERITFGALLCISFTWGSFIKFFIYHEIFRQKFSERPINVLILVDQIADHIIKTGFLFYLFPKVRTYLLQLRKFSLCKKLSSKITL